MAALVPSLFSPSLSLFFYSKQHTQAPQLLQRVARAFSAQAAPAGKRAGKRLYCPLFLASLLLQLLTLSLPSLFNFYQKQRRRFRSRRLGHRPGLVPRAAEADPRADGGDEGKEGVSSSWPDEGRGGREREEENDDDDDDRRNKPRLSTPTPLSHSLSQKTKNSKTKQSIPVPLSGDPAAVKKFAADVEALKRKAGVPDEAELEAALVSFRLKASGGDVRKALAALTADDSDLDAALSAALEQAEKESGGALTDANAKGWALLASKVQALAKARGLDDVAKVKSEATVKMYAEALKSLRDGAADAVSAAARRDGLEGVVSVDAAALKPKW